MADNTDEEIVENDDEAAEVEEEVEADEKDGDDVVPVRKSVINAQRRIINKQREKLAEKEEPDDEELTPKAQNLIRKEVQPVMDFLKKSADDIEVERHMVRHPEDAKLEKQIRRRMEAWKDVPVGEIVKTLKYEGEQEGKTERKREATEKAKGSKLGGSSNRAEEVKLPTQADHAEIYKRMKRGEQLDVESGQYSPAKR